MAKEIVFPTGNETLDRFMIDVVWKTDKSVRLYEKRSSVLMWALYVIGFMWIWMPGFFKSFNTTIGKRVYIRENAVLLQNWIEIYKVMRHEFIHILQRKKYWILYDISYLLPQLFSILSLFSLLSIWLGSLWLYSLVWVAFLLPLPSYGRATFEFEAYTQTMLVFFEMTGKIPKHVIGNIASMFTGPSYYFMWPFRHIVISKLDDIADDIIGGKIKGPYLHYRG